METLCLTFWNGRFCGCGGQYLVSAKRFSADLELLDDAACALELILLECKHGLVPLPLV